MIRAKYVPKSSVENAIATFTVEGASWEDVIAAAINAWPGFFQTTTQINRDATEVLILPLPTENTNDQA